MSCCHYYAIADGHESAFAVGSGPAQGLARLQEHAARRFRAQRDPTALVVIAEVVGQRDLFFELAAGAGQKPQAHQDLEGRNTTGSTILVP